MKGYKLAIATLLGFITLLLMYFPIIYNVQGLILVIVWHRIVPLLVALAWGSLYGLVALVPGCAAIVDGLYWVPTGWNGFMIFSYYFFWILGHGYCAERRRKNKGFIFSIYVVQLFFSLLYAAILCDNHPIMRTFDPFAPLDFLQGEFSLVFRRLYIIKSFINELLLVAVADALLMVPLLRRMFRLPVPACQRYNSKMILIAVCLSAVFAVIASAACEILINQDYYFHWLWHPTERLKIVLFLSVIFGVIAGGIGIRFLERKLAADDELRRSEEKWRSLFDGMQDIYLEENLDGIVTMVSPSIQDHLGYSPVEIVGRQSSFLYAETEMQIPLFSAYRTFEILLNREVQFRDKTGGTHWMALNSMKKKDADGEEKIVVIAKDITTLKEAMNEIRNMNLRLEQRVAERTEELESFVYNVSHDLKSPLRSIEGYSRFIQEDYAQELNPDALKMIKNVQEIALDMIKLIDKLLEYVTTTKIDTLTREKTDMQELLVTVFDELMVTCPERVVYLNIVDTLPCLMVDRILLKQVIINLFSNAIKFTRGKNPARIRVECHQANTDYIFTIRDNGVGFDMEYAKKLFGIFQRLHSKEEFEGFGIGLATVRNIIEKHGGRSWIQGKENEGTAVFFSLPAGE